MCDLAGSEKFQNDNEKNSLEQQNEIIKINQSLSTLEQVIHSLSINQNNFSSFLIKLDTNFLGPACDLYFIIIPPDLMENRVTTDGRAL